MKTLIITLMILLITVTANAKEFSLDWSEVRFFLTETSFANKDENVNALLQPDQIEELNKVTGFGLEVDAQVLSWFKAGTKIKGVFNGSNKKEAAFPATEYFAIQQYSAGLTGRIGLVNKEKFFLDVFGELGLSNNTIELKATAGTAKWEQNSYFYQRAGSSLGFGGSGFKMYVEGGYENFKLDNLKHQGSVGQNITEMDLSGPYVGVGLIISGLPSWIKPGGLSIGGL